MKIMHIIPQLGAGGAEKFCVDLCNSQVDHGEVTLCVLHDVSDEKTGFFRGHVSDKVKIISMKKRSGFDLFLFVKFFFLFARIKPDVINTHLIALLYATPASIFFKIKRLHTIHNVAHKEHNIKLIRKIYKIFYKLKLVTPIAISSIVRETMISEYNLENIPLIENGVKRPEKTELFLQVSDFFSSLRKSPATKILLCIARFSPQKNLKLLVSSFSKITNQGADMQLVIIGDGPKEIKDELHEIANQRVSFVGAKKNIGDYLVCSDAFCLSSLWEGLPITIIEAFACETPILTTPAGGVPDVVIDNESGLVTNGFDEKEYFNMLSRYYELPKAQITKIKSTISQLYESRYNIAITAKKYIDVYKT